MEEEGCVLESVKPSAVSIIGQTPKALLKPVKNPHMRKEKKKMC